MKAKEAFTELMEITPILILVLWILSIFLPAATLKSEVTMQEGATPEEILQRYAGKDIRVKEWDIPIPHIEKPEWKIPDNPYILEIEEVTKAYTFVDDLDCLIYAMIKCESNFDPNCKSSAGCIGLMQVSEYWHKDRAAKLGVDDLWDPYGNILTATDFLKDLYYNYANRDIVLAVMMYNMNFADAKRIYNSGKMSQYAIDVFRIFDELKGV